MPTFSNLIKTFTARLLAPFTLSVAFFGCSEPPDRLVLSSSRNGDGLEVYEQSQTIGIGMYSYTAYLVFNQKKVDVWHHTVPMLASAYPDLVIQFFSDAPDGWTIHMSPQHFTRSEFDRLVTLYAANKSQIDVDLLKGFVKTGTEKFRTIGRFVYGERPQPMVFKPVQLRYQPTKGSGFSDRAMISQEELVLQPDGQWQHYLAVTDKGMTQTSLALRGQLQREDDTLYFTPPPQSTWNEMPGSIRSDAVSGEEYLRSMVNEAGKRLDEVLVWK